MYYKQISILLIIIIFGLIFLLNKKSRELFINNRPKLVVLYSTQYRTWADTCQNHVELIRHLAGSEDNCIVGIHYWNNNTPDLPPEPIRKLRYKHSHTDQNLPTTEFSTLLSVISSTKIALENAKQLYRELYNEEMPDDQLILRLRPDAHINNIPDFPKTTYGNNFYVSMWNSNHRSYVENAPETSDVIGLTTKKTMELLVNTNIQQLENIIQNYRTNGRTILFIEHALYTLLESFGTTIKNIENLKLGLMRIGNKVETLTY